MAPSTMIPGGNPVTETPGLLSATFPITVVGPALVTVELPRIATFSAAPREIEIWPDVDEVAATNAKTISAAAHTGPDAWVSGRNRPGNFFSSQRGRFGS